MLVLRQPDVTTSHACHQSSKRLKRARCCLITPLYELISKAVLWCIALSGEKESVRSVLLANHIVISSLSDVYIAGANARSNHVCISKKYPNLEHQKICFSRILHLYVGRRHVQVAQISVILNQFSHFQNKPWNHQNTTALFSGESC